MFPVAVRMVWDVYEAVKLPIIGCGGVSSAEDVCEMMMAGATAVEVGAANLRDPYACKTIVEQPAPGSASSWALPASRNSPAPPTLIPSKSLNFKRKDLFAMSAKDVIIALDFPTREETLTFLDQFPAGGEALCEDRHGALLR